MAAVASPICDGCVCHGAVSPHPIGYGVFLTGKSANPDASVSSPRSPPPPHPPPPSPSTPLIFSSCCNSRLQSEPRLIHRRVCRSTLLSFSTYLSLTPLYFELPQSLSLLLLLLLSILCSGSLADCFSYFLIDFLSHRQPCRSSPRSDWHSPASPSVSPSLFLLLLSYSLPSHYTPLFPPHCSFSQRNKVWTLSNIASQIPCLYSPVLIYCNCSVNTKLMTQQIIKLQRFILHTNTAWCMATCCFLCMK